jgi:hypothetical protein
MTANKLIDVVVLSKKVLAHDVVTMRTARGGENAPLIISIPSSIVKAAKYKKVKRFRYIQMVKELIWKD